MAIMKLSKTCVFTSETILVLMILLLLKRLVNLNSPMDQANYSSLKVCPIFNKFEKQYKEEVWINYTQSVLIRNDVVPVRVIAYKSVTAELR